MATKKQARTRGRRRRAHANSEVREERERALIRKQKTLRDSVHARYQGLVQSNVHVPRELLSTMSTLEALTDQLADEGIIDRTLLNVTRFEYLLKYLSDLEENQPQTDSTEVPSQ